MRTLITLAVLMAAGCTVGYVTGGQETEERRRYLSDYADPADYTHELPDGGFDTYPLAKEGK